MRGGIRITERKIQEMIEEGRGSGELGDYKPSIINRDLPGRSRKIDLQQESNLGWKTGRSHHLQNLSQEGYFMLLNWSDEVFDIREHFPLHTFRECMRIADRIGVTYPLDPVTGHPLVLTVTFLLTVLTEREPVLKARTVIRCALEKLPKHEANLLYIEKLYCAERGIDWGYINPQKLNDKWNKIYNIKRFYPHRGLDRLHSLSNAQIEWAAVELTHRVLEFSSPLRSLALKCDYDLNLPEGTSMNIARHLLANKRWVINMNVKFDENRPLILLNADHLA